MIFYLVLVLNSQYNLLPLMMEGQINDRRISTRRRMMKLKPMKNLDQWFNMSTKLLFLRQEMAFVKEEL